ncbi:MAG: hypothetical protein NVSMB7_01680 [Chitinophagaceae bacterium]
MDDETLNACYAKGEQLFKEDPLAEANKPDLYIYTTRCNPLLFIVTMLTAVGVMALARL